MGNGRDVYIFWIEIVENSWHQTFVCFLLVLFSFLWKCDVMRCDAMRHFNYMRSNMRKRVNRKDMSNWITRLESKTCWSNIILVQFKRNSLMSLSKNLARIYTVNFFLLLHFEMIFSMLCFNFRTFNRYSSYNLWFSW